MIPITPTLSLRDDEIELDFVRSSGAGGQNVNKVATAVQLRFNIAASPSLPDDAKERLIQLGGSRVTSESVLILKAQTQRTQEGNRAEAVERLVALVRRALVRPTLRRATKPTRASQRRRVEDKRQLGAKKRARRGQAEE